MKMLYPLLIGLLAAQSSACLASSLRVEQDGSGDYLALQPAVDAAASGDTILIGPGWYQELNWVDHYGTPIEVAAYWTDDKDLYFIGSSAAEVMVGPTTYAPHLDGPQGIFQEGLFRNSLFVSNVSFVNLYVGANSFGTIVVENCHFETGEYGAVATQGAACRVVGSLFENIDRNACSFFSCTMANVDDCELGASVYFGSVGTGNINNCTASGKQLGYYYQSNGSVSNNEAICTVNNCLAIGEGSRVEISNNHLSGGSNGLSILGMATHVTMYNNTVESPDSHNIQIRAGATLDAYGNDFVKAHGTGKYFVSVNSYSGGAEPTVISMKNNYWADELTGPYVSAFQVGFYIWDYNDDPGQKAVVDFDPFSTRSVPIEIKPFGSLKSMYR